MSLTEAMAAGPVWLRVWIQVLIAVNLAGLLFAVRKHDGRWQVRWEPIVIVAAFVAAAILMGRLYEAFGYVRLLGLAHLVFWGPAWLWIFSRRREFELRSLFGAYLHVYLLIAGISLVVDAIDVARYALGG